MKFATTKIEIVLIFGLEYLLIFSKIISNLLVNFPAQNIFIEISSFCAFKSFLKVAHLTDATFKNVVGDPVHEPGSLASKAIRKPNPVTRV